MIIVKLLMFFKTSKYGENYFVDILLVLFGFVFGALIDFSEL